MGYILGKGLPATSGLMVLGSQNPTSLLSAVHDTKQGCLNRNTKVARPWRRTEPVDYAADLVTSSASTASVLEKWRPP